MLILTETLRSYRLTRRLARLGRPALLDWQAQALARWLAQDLPRAPFYRGCAGRPLDTLPPTDKTTLMADFAAFNSRGIGAAEAWQIIEQGTVQGDLIAGCSTGTSGNRGLFLASRAESYRWLGAILAHAIPDLLTRPQRVALILPQTAGLYRPAQGAWFRLRHFSLTQGPEAWRKDIESFRPTVLIAPPKILRHLAEARFALTPTRSFAAAETLDPVDRPVIEAAFGAPLRQIYMATEGLLAVSCPHGTLHLCEDQLAFEFEPLGALVIPRITAFRRQTQIMARYAMNDLLRLLGTCPCGLPLQAVAEVVGRMDDVFHLGGRLVTPDILRNAVIDANRAITDFRIFQTGPLALRLVLPPDQPGAEAALAALTTLVRGLAPGAEITLERRALPLDTSRKLRRVERLWRPEGTA